MPAGHWFTSGTASAAPENFESLDDLLGTLVAENWRALSFP